MQSAPESLTRFHIPCLALVQAVNFAAFDSYHRMLITLSGADGNRERFAAGAAAGVNSACPYVLKRFMLVQVCVDPGKGMQSQEMAESKGEAQTNLHAACVWGPSTNLWPDTQPSIVRLLIIRIPAKCLEFV
jgi:hypothetical protein